MKRLFGGGILIFIGLFMLLGLVAGDSDETFAVLVVMFVLFIFAPITIGSGLIYSHFKQKRTKQLDQQQDLELRQEKEVIRLAQRSRGRLSIPEIVADTSMSTAEAELLMQTMTQKGYVDMQVTDSGVIVYEFYEIAHRHTFPENPEE
jgi:hypothetical protein